MAKKQSIHVPIEEEPLQEHTDVDLFCFNMTCPCHEDHESIKDTFEQMSDGLMTGAEAARYYRGGHI